MLHKRPVFRLMLGAVVASLSACKGATDSTATLSPRAEFAQASTTIAPEVLVGGYHANSVNQTGDAVGDVRNPVFCNYAPLPTLWHADGSRIALPLGSFCGGSPLRINSSGVILGSLSGGPANSTGLWFPSSTGYTLTVLPAASDGYRPLTGGGLNDNAHVLGWGQGFARLYWWSSGTGWISMNVPSGATFCQASRAINNYDQIASKCTVRGVGNGYYWSSPTATPILLPSPAGLGDVTPRGMNDAGVIVGGGSGVGLRWVPTPSGYKMDVFPAGVPEAIAADGMMAGSVSRNFGSSLPVLFLPTLQYQLLGLTTSGTWGTAGSISVTLTGHVIGGTEANAKALRWKTP
jgi:hypothetical protein